MNDGDYYVESSARVKDSEGVYHWVGYTKNIDESMIESIYLKNIMQMIFGMVMDMAIESSLIILTF